MALTKGGILKHAASFTPREVHVPALADDSGDDVVLVRGMTLREFELSQSYADDGKGTATVISQCVIDEAGNRVFGKEDIGALAELPIAATKLITKAIMEASGFGSDDDADVAQAVADAEGKSETTPPSDSSSD
jgi:hypothetical protein